jgi:hypothetical protein
MKPQLPDLREIDLERQHSALRQEGRSPRPLESWTEPPYEILCPLGFHEVPDVSRWDQLRIATKMDRGLYVCQPLVGYYTEVGTHRTPCWCLAVRVLLGSSAEKILLRTFWLSERAIERSTADLRRLRLPLSIARQTVEFDRGGVLAVVDLNLNEDDRYLPYKIFSMHSLAGIAALHAEFLDYEFARLPYDRTGGSPTEGLPVLNERDHVDALDRGSQRRGSP